ncbi:MAG: peptidoglycan DD-metalloendopeptidase family protein, partial [Thermotogota bacterium]|nr:peptidoglycan DD-metalloendopeptidase family protein [Thermotogota bacterium]
IICFFLIILIFPLSSCSVWWITKEEFNSEMSVVKDRLNEISGQSEDLEEIKKEIDSLSGDLSDIDKHLDIIEKLIDDSGEYKKIEEILNEMSKIRKKLNEIEVTGTNNKEMVEKIDSKIDEFIRSVEEEMVVEKELQNIKILLEEIEKSSDEEEKSKISSLESRIEHLENIYSSEASTLSLEMFLSEIADIRSRAGSNVLNIEQKYVKYTVRSGDTLWEITSAYNIDLGDLRTSNPELKESDIIHSGDELIIPVNFGSYLQPDLVRTAIGIPDSYEKLISSIVSTYGSYKNGYANPGVDLKLESSTYIRSILPGRVIEAREMNEFYGLGVLIEHGDGYRTVYSRLGYTELERGDFVRAGDVVGITKEDEVNLHFEIWQNEIPVNPADLLFNDVGKFKVTMYTEWDDGKNPTSPSFKVTSSGTYVKQFRTVSADPEVFPAGTIIYVPYFANEPNKGFFVVEDTGNEIKGKRLDIYIRDYEIASNFNKDLLVYKVYSP